MAKIRIHVWHNTNGQIVAIGRPVDSVKSVPLSSENHSVLEAEVEEEQIANLPQTHVADVSQKVLLERSQLKGLGR